MEIARERLTIPFQKEICYFVFNGGDDHDNAE